ncbi:putative trans-acting enoyl reductase [Streptomyces sp. RB5]|uniref:Putative trans-acting enoyl reductase n=1 Tax=Streptomyces smaragdinus TaxID=2585196 RepID=A0A7K0CN47_9ACTN|nr:saccharopine dehydrogenase NADP-binding domain-containing protein [Streptomyces smaragdinus]MQY14703.1 putative trans-acting enoyl reductase [Streptomyces smaragdinus]
MTRDHDLVLFGATGFTGRLTAGYLARHAPPSLRWALAGRTLDKLRRVRTELAAEHPELAELPLLQADATDTAALRKVAESTRAVATTVGPYIVYGGPLVAACAEAGTDYLDLCGEPEFVDLTWLRHQDRAVETGARLIHACGFDSVPYDLGVRFTVEQLPEHVPLTVDGFVRVGGRPSGGTFASALTAFSRARQTMSAARARRAAEPRPKGRRVSTPVGTPRRAGEVGCWAVPLATIDPQIVGRSAVALERYGPEFRYRNYAAVKRLPVAVGGVAGVGALIALAQVAPVRRRLSARLAPGTGPSPELRERSWFCVRFVGEGGGRRVVTEVRGGDPGYDETAKMLAESALCLLSDDVPPTAGQTTTAAAMGGALTERLVGAGITFRVVEASP